MSRGQDDNEPIIPWTKGQVKGIVWWYFKWGIVCIFVVGFIWKENLVPLVTAPFAAVGGFASSFGQSSRDAVDANVMPAVRNLNKSAGSTFGKQGDQELQQERE